MTVAAVKRWRRLCLYTGIVLCLAGAILYASDRTYRDFSDRLNQADTHYQARRYHEAITAYKHILHRATRLPVRLSMWILAQPLRPARLSLQIANCHYRLAEAELRHYRQAVNDPRLTPRPSLGTVQRLLTVAAQAYADVPATDPQAYMAALVNGVRIAAWQLILAAFDEQTTGRRSLRQQAVQAIKQAARAVDYGHRQAQEVDQQTRMHAMLLLETLTAFSQERPPPRPPGPAPDAWRGRLGDLLLRTRPELSSQERQRFREFFFALPPEARDPWPTGGQDGAAAGRRPVAH